VLAYAIGRVVAPHGNTVWVKALKDGLVPVTLGLILASGLVMGRAADHGLLSEVVSGGTAVFIMLTTRNPLWMLGAGTVAGFAGGYLGAM
jgi:chromate transporter